MILEEFLAVLRLKMESCVRKGGVEASSQGIAMAENFLLSQAREQRLERTK